MNCQYCDSHCKKDGKQKDGTQKYRCCSCKKYQQQNYVNAACSITKKNMICMMRDNEFGVRKTARSLDISINTVIKTDRYRRNLPVKYNMITERAYRYVP